MNLGVVESPGGDTFELFFGRQRNYSLSPDELKGSVDFGLGPIKSWLLEYSNPTKVAIYQYRITTAQMDQTRGAKSVVFHTEGAGDSAFALSDMSSLLDAMRKCTSDLQAFWNMDKSSSRVATPSKGSVRAIFTSDDFPKSAYYRAQEGSAQYLLLIDEKGTVAGCHIVKPSGVPILDAMGCAVLQARTRLEPAKDADGKPVRSTFVTPLVNWRMESL